MIKRERYLEKIRPFYDSDLIKVITGIRRCGKSVILKQIKEEISKETDNIIFLELESVRLQKLIPDVDALLKYVDENRKEGKCYIFLDEIQMLNGWQDACKTLRLEDNSVFITGSNSKLLSSEFTKELSGRYVSFRVRPFVYRELLAYAKELKKEISISDYLIYGGFPKALEFDGESKLDYLYDLNQTIIYNDIMERYTIKNRELFKNISDFVLRANSRILSTRSITNYVNSNNQSASINTVINYVSYLEEAFAINKIKPYSTKTKQELAYKFKVYDEDVSFNSIRCFDGKFDLDHNLENVVYNELIYMGYDVFVLNSNEKEIDFRAKKDNKIYLIQVAYSVVDEKAYEREFAPFNQMDNSCQKVLITTDDVDFSTSTVRHIKLKDFLLMEDIG